MRRLILKRIMCIALASVLLASCASSPDKQTLASLESIEPLIVEAKITDSLDKAMQSYQKFLQETPESSMTPEALRRLADLKIEKEYSALNTQQKAPLETSQSLIKADNRSTAEQKRLNSKSIANLSESEKDFENRAAKKSDVKKSRHKAAQAKKSPSASTAENQDLETAGALQAIELYKSLLIKYPNFERNDQVLYQLSRAYEEIGKIEAAMLVLNQLVKQYPNSRHLDEAQFRRAEYFFTRKKYLDSEEAYQAVIKFGVSSAFYDLSLYKQGWSYFKQELYEEALNDFIALLDYKISIGYDFEQVTDKIERKRIEDTYRVISLSFSYLGGANEVVRYFEQHGQRQYEASIYSHLGEYYLTKRRYADAASAYNSYVERNPLNKVSPHFHIRVIEIYLQGGFPKLVIEAKKNFSTTYGLRSSYWTFFNIDKYPVVLAYLKTNLIDLANHYHALYQNQRLRQYKNKNFLQASHWYSEFLDSFPEDQQASAINFQLAELLLENKDFRGAALAYERTSYNYPRHAKSSAAGYAAVYAFRQYLDQALQSQRVMIKRQIISSSLKFAESYPSHEKAAIVLVAAVDDLYAVRDFSLAIKIARRVIKNYPNIDKKYIRSCWLVVAHASFDLAVFNDAELAYTKVLSLTEKQHKNRHDLVENLAASIYKQGEQALKLKKYLIASEHFLRLASAAPDSIIRPTAEYDAATALMSLKLWSKAAQVLERFRLSYPKHKMQSEVTKKLALVYKADKKYFLAAEEFERIEKQTHDNGIRREALEQAAQLYEMAGKKHKALGVYIRYVKYFPRPLENSLEIRQKIADIYKFNKSKKLYVKQLQWIVAIELKAGEKRTDRTRFLAANASLILAETGIRRFKSVKLVKPFKKNLNKKKKRMKKSIATLSRLVDYGVSIVTAAATYEIAEIYYHFSRALMESERPDNLTELQLEQYELVLEEQIYPFEEKAISVHEKNMELLDLGVYNLWIDKSLKKLSHLLPARYAKNEEAVSFIQIIQPLNAVPEKINPDLEKIKKVAPSQSETVIEKKQSKYLTSDKSIKTKYLAKKTAIKNMLTFTSEGRI